MLVLIHTITPGFHEVHTLRFALFIPLHIECQSVLVLSSYINWKKIFGRRANNLFDNYFSVSRFNPGSRLPARRPV